MKDLQLYKYGKRRHICDLIHNGKLCLNPASKYDDEKLSKGAYDPEELEYEQTLPPGVKFEGFCGKTGKSKGKFEAESIGPLVAQSDTDFYIFCMAYRYIEDLYGEFNADTCLVISDPDRFMNQAISSIVKALPDWTVNAGSVRYKFKNEFRTMWPSYEDIFYGKDADEYAHQFEIRIVCVPPKPKMKLSRRFVNIGNLHGYTLITGLETPNKTIKSEHTNALGSPFKCS